MTTRLRTLLGDHPGTTALKHGTVKSDRLTFDFADYQPTNKGFKPMVRLLVTSSAYRQSSRPRDDLASADPSNHLYARQSASRREAEEATLRRKLRKAIVEAES